MNLDEKLARDRERAFPEAILEPWKAKVAQAQAERVEPLHKDWQAHMLPMPLAPYEDGGPYFALTRQDSCDSTKGTRYRMTITGTDQEDVIGRAWNFDLRTP